MSYILSIARFHSEKNRYSEECRLVRDHIHHIGYFEDMTDALGAMSKMASAMSGDEDRDEACVNDVHYIAIKAESKYAVLWVSETQAQEKASEQSIYAPFKKFTLAVQKQWPDTCFDICIPSSKEESVDTRFILKADKDSFNRENNNLLAESLHDVLAPLFDSTSRGTHEQLHWKYSAALGMYRRASRTVKSDFSFAVIVDARLIKSDLLTVDSIISNIAQAADDSDQRIYNFDIIPYGVDLARYPRVHVSNLRRFESAPRFYEAPLAKIENFEPDYQLIGRMVKRLDLSLAIFITDSSRFDCLESFEDRTFERCANGVIILDLAENAEPQKVGDNILRVSVDSKEISIW